MSRAIRFVTISEYSHVALILRDGSVIEAWDSGVRHVKNLSDQHTPGTVVDIFEFEKPLTDWEEHLAEDYLKSQRGKKYDWLAVLCFLPGIRLLYHLLRRWYGWLLPSCAPDQYLFCSELADRAVFAALRKLFNERPAELLPPALIPCSLALRYSETVITV